MSARARLLGIGALGVVAALLWTSFGTVLEASGQEQGSVIRRAHEGSLAPNYKKPIFMLVLGGDARDGNPGRTRMDSIHILGIDPVGKRASILGIPRDTYVEIPGRGRRKINDAGVAGGPELMTRTVEALSGCVFDYYLLTSFEGFTKLVNEFGGVTLDVEQRLYERTRSRIDLKPGRQRLNGKQALAYARVRYVGRPRGDFDRSLSHGRLAIAALEEARSDYRANGGSVLRALSALRRHVKMDIPLEEALKLGLFALKIEPENVKNEVIDGQVGTAGGASVVQITTAGRNQLVDICGDGVLGG